MVEQAEPERQPRESREPTPKGDTRTMRTQVMFDGGARWDKPADPWKQQLEAMVYDGNGFSADVAETLGIKEES